MQSGPLLTHYAVLSTPYSLCSPVHSLLIMQSCPLLTHYAVLSTPVLPRPS
jgi:hypothetical protein